MTYHARLIYHDKEVTTFMQRVVFLVFVLAVSLMGCGKKKDVSENLPQEALSIEALSTTASNISSASQVQSRQLKPLVTIETEQGETILESLPPQGPYKPTPSQIQTALANAGFYSGKVDGKVGPVTKKAVEEFQKVNGLEADGKVGPKTWAVLSKHLSIDSAAEHEKRK